jgi:DNA polymerase
LQPGLADLLAYLGELGYGDLYLEASQAGAAPGQAAARPAAEAPAAVTAAGGETAESAAELDAMAAVVAGCTRCRLCEGRTKAVFGAGNPDANLMFIGEGPGAEEDRRGLPFVGAAGELLTRIIQAIEMRRDEVYIANVV